MDNDGLVHYSSQMGFRLGTTTDSFFNHTQLDHIVDLKPAPGSWYRMYTSALDGYSHNVMFYKSMKGVSNAVMNQNPGPLVAQTGNLSVYATP